MENKKSRKTTAPPESSESQSSFYDYNLTLYDSLPYHRDSDTCNQRYLIDHSNRIIHSYRYDTEPYQIGKSSDTH